MHRHNNAVTFAKNKPCLPSKNLLPLLSLLHRYGAVPSRQPFSLVIPQNNMSLLSRHTMAAKIDYRPASFLAASASA